MLEFKNLEFNHASHQTENMFNTSNNISFYGKNGYDAHNQSLKPPSYGELRSSKA